LKNSNGVFIGKNGRKMAEGEGFEPLAFNPRQPQNRTTCSVAIADLIGVTLNAIKEIFTNPASQRSVEDTITARPVPWGLVRFFGGCFGGISVFARLYKAVMIISYARNVMDAASTILCSDFSMLQGSI
jgi:hypothetical protein